MLGQPGATIIRNHYACAVSIPNTRKGGCDFKLIKFTWVEEVTDPSSTGVSVTTVQNATRSEVQSAFVKVMARPNHSWWCLDALKTLLLKVPLEKRQSEVWLDAARIATEVAAIFRQQYRDRGESGTLGLADTQYDLPSPFIS